MIEDMTDQATSPRSRRGSVAPGPASRRQANSTSRVPGKAQQAIDKPAPAKDVTAEHVKQIPRMIFLNRPKDTLAPDDGKPHPLRILGQVAGPNGEIIEAKTGKVVVPAYGQTLPVADDGLGEGEDRLELVEDLPLPCPACGGGGRQRTGFGDRTEPCDDCGGSGTLQ